MDERAGLHENFIEQFGLDFEADNMPRIAGRILGLLLLEEEPLGFGEIAERLKVSRGSVSTNSRLLLRLKAIERVTKFGDRRDYFQVTAQPFRYQLGLWTEFADNQRSLTEAVIDTLDEGQGKLRGRLRSLSRCMKLMGDATRDVIARLDSEDEREG